MLLVPATRPGPYETSARWVQAAWVKSLARIRQSNPVNSWLALTAPAMRLLKHCIGGKPISGASGLIAALACEFPWACQGVMSKFKAAFFKVVA
jgi:hypothetical protein